MITDPIVNIVPAIFEECQHILNQRAQDYADHSGMTVDDYMPLGAASYYQMCFLKVQRAFANFRNGKLPDDSLLDLINYAAFWLAYSRLKEQNSNGNVQPV